MERVGQKILVNGIYLYYEKVGIGDHVLLLLPGVLGTTKTDFDIQLETFDRHHFTMIAWDPPGYGQSRPPARKFNTNHWHEDAEFAAALMKELGYSQYSLVGWSNGGCSACILAARYSERVQKLVIWGVVSFITDEEVKHSKATKSDVSGLNIRAVYPYIKIYGKTLFEKMWMDAHNLYITRGESGNTDLFSSELKNISAPTLIIHGNKDVFVPKFQAEYLHEHIKSSRLIFWEDGKHNLHIRFPERFKFLVENFLLDRTSSL